MARELTAFSLSVTMLAVPATAASAMLVLPPAGALSMNLKYFSGGSMEVFNAPQGSTAAAPLTNGVTLGSGYLMGAAEVVTVSGAPKFYLACTGATGVAYLMFGLSQGS